MTVVYADLKRRASVHLRAESRDVTLNPTALVHEAYLRLVDADVGIRAADEITDEGGRFGDNPAAVSINNADWLLELKYIPFLRDIGRHFSVNRMLTFDSVQLRLEREQSLSFLEFNYMITQAYDFLELERRLGCRLQMGGSDQWGNIINGVELCRRADGVEVFGLTTPLITTADGAKMGKTEQGAVWLNEDQLSPYDYWQFWRNTDDADVGKFLRRFTDVPVPEIAKVLREPGSIGLPACSVTSRWSVSRRG